MQYVNCNITIAGHTIQYVEDGLAGTRELEGTLGDNALRILTVRRLSHWINYAMTQEATQGPPLARELEDLKVLGLHLYHILFATEKVRDRFQKTYREVKQKCLTVPDLRLRLWLVFEPGTEHLAGLPWEFLFIAEEDNLDTGVFVAGERTELLLTRKIKVPDFVQNLSPKESDLRILLVTCQPEKIEREILGQIDEREVEELIKTIQGLGATTRWVTVEHLRNPAYGDLKRRIDSDKPHIIHYVGHGKEGNIALSKHGSDPDYDIAAGGEQFRWVTSKQVKALFTDQKPRLVFLNACKGAASESVESFKSTARDLVYAGIPGVVAMQYGITNADAIIFAKRFYEEIGKGKEVDEAVKLGRKALGDLFPPWGHPRFATPVVYLQSSEAFVEPSETGGPAETAAAGRPAQSGTPATVALRGQEPRAAERRAPEPEGASFTT
jgi:hypothetical protein